MYHSLYAFPATGGYERPHFGRGFERVADPHLLGFPGESRDEVVVDIPLYEQARARRAALPGISKPALHGGGRRLRKIGVGKNDVRALAPELQRHALDIVGRGFQKRGARSCFPGECDFVDERMTGYVLAKGSSRSRYHIEHALRQIDLERDPRQQQGGQGRVACRLEKYGAAGSQSGRHFPRGRQERKIPGRDLRGDTHRFAKGKIEYALAHRDRLAEQLIRGAGIIMEYACGRFDLVARIRDGLAAGTRLDLGNEFDVATDVVGDRAEKASTLGRQQSRPAAPIESSPSGSCRSVDILQAGTRNFGMDGAVQRTNDGKSLAGETRREASVYEQVGLEFDHQELRVMSAFRCWENARRFGTMMSASECSVGHPATIQAVRKPNAFGPRTSFSRSSPTNHVVDAAATSSAKANW